MRYSFLLSVGSSLLLVSPVFAGQVGSNSTNVFTHEQYSGREWSSGNSQSLEHINGVSRSSSAKAEFLPQPGAGAVRAQFGAYSDSNGNSSAYCNASVGNVDPACLTSTSRTDATFGKVTQSNSSFGRDGHFSGTVDTVSIQSGSSF